MNSNDIKSLFTFNSTWQTTSWKHLKNSLNFTLWMAFIYQNAPFWKSTQSFLFWNWKQCPAIMKLSSVIWCQIFSWINKQVQNLRFVYKNVPCLFYYCYTQTPWVMFSIVVNTLRFAQDFLKIINEKHQRF